MAQKVIWSHEATIDLEEIAEYIARDSSFYAATFVRGICQASRLLTEFAKRGRVVPELSDSDIRELLVREYRLIYRIEESRVVILAFVHGTRDLRRLWDKEKRN